MSRSASSNNLVLKMPLDLTLAIDKEVYEILNGFHSGVEIKNFLCSAILYYARSPLVLSANALTEKLNSFDFAKLELLLEKISFKVDSVSFGVVSGVDPSPSPVVLKKSALDDGALSTLSSLKEKFKI